MYFLGLIAGQRELFQVGRDLNAQTGSLSPLVAAGLFYLLLTIPLTHLVNVVDRRLRDGRPATSRTIRCVGREPGDGMNESSQWRWRAMEFTCRSVATRCYAASTSPRPPGAPSR